MRSYALLGMTMLIGGCASLQSADPASPYYAYTSGWTVQLNRSLTIPADAATVRLQYGRLVPRNSVQEYDPFCIVELDTVSAAPQTLRPGRFELWRVTRSVSTLTASVDPAFVPALFIDDDAPTFLYYITEFRLRDQAQPTLRGMRCAWNQMAPGRTMRHLTVGEIQRALGDWMTLRPPEVRI